jgi:hypothetical protein
MVLELQKNLEFFGIFNASLKLNFAFVYTHILNTKCLDKHFALKTNHCKQSVIFWEIEH